MMATLGTWQIFILSVAIMAFAVGVFYITLSGDLPDPDRRKRTLRKGWGLVGVFIAGVLVAGL